MSDSDRIDALEATVEALKEERERYREQVIKPELAELRAERDDAREERVELREQLASLQQQVDAVYGLAEGERSTPAKRAADLRMALIRRANNSTGPSAGRSSMYYQEIQDCFADLGHETVHRPECMQAMEDAADADGFSLGTKTSEHGNEVKAIRVDTDALPAGVACRDSTTPDTAGSGSDALLSDRNTTQDSH